MGMMYERATTSAKTEATTTTTPSETSGLAMRPNGEACAALVAAGIGSAVLGLIIPLSEAIVPLKSGLNWLNPVGPLSGKTSVAVVAWLIAWAVLHVMWKDKEQNFGTIFLVTLILVGVGLVGTFPPVFEFFTAH